MKKEKAPFNPAFNESGLKQLWRHRIANANKGRNINMSGRSEDDECKERIYRALNAILSGGGETARSLIDRELKMLRDHAVQQHDDPLIFSIDRVQRLIFELDLNSSGLPSRVENVKDEIYKLETY